MRFPVAVIVALLSAVHALAEALPTSVEVTLEPPRFGDTASILQVDSTVASFRFDQPVRHLAIVLESRPKEPRTVHVARLALELEKPVKEGRFCVQMADQGFIPLGNGSPNQMQLFMQLDCGGTLISSSQSFLKEKFNFSRSRARTGAGTLTRKVAGNRAPVFWLMGNSDDGTYFNDDDLDKMVAKNKDAYVLIAYLEVAKEAPAATPVLAQTPGREAKPSDAPGAGIPKSSPDPATAVPSPVMAVAFVGPPYPVPVKPEANPATTATKPKSTTSGTTSSSKGGTKPSSSKSSKSSSSKKKKKN